MNRMIELFPMPMRENVRKSGVLDISLEEIRIRINQPVIFHTSGGDLFLCGEKLRRSPDASCLRMTEDDLNRIFAFLSEYSAYAYEEELKRGYLTLDGGHRVGIGGSVSLQDGRIRRIFPVRFLNIRISHPKTGCASEVFDSLYENGRFCNTLVYSAPGLGKTTLLRDLVRMVSDGKGRIPGRKVGLVDERCEIAGGCRGIPQNDIGMRTDVLDACPKAEGMMILIRAMSPEILAVDEIGDCRDLSAIVEASRCGIGILASAHADSLDELHEKPGWDMLFGQRIFSRMIGIRMENGVRVYSVHSAEHKLLFPGAASEGGHVA